MTSKEKNDLHIEIEMVRQSRKSRSTRAGIIFPVARMHRYLKTGPNATTRVTQGASVYTAAVIEYLVGMYSIQSSIIIENIFLYSGIIGIKWQCCT